MPTLTLFDLDHTLISVDSNQAWISFLIDLGRIDAHRYREEAAAMERRYRSKVPELDLEFCEFFIASLRLIAPSELPSLLAQFVATRIVPHVSPAARALVEAHRHVGDTLAIITATNRILVEPIATVFGIEHLIATEPEIVAGELTGKVKGVPSMRSGKVSRLIDWLAAGHVPGVSIKEGLDVLRFYSDSINDRALLLWATEAIAVDPDPELRALANEQRWPIVALAG